MSSEPANPATDADERQPTPRELAADEMPCPVCGSPMPDLKGGKASICSTCGFKDSCCF
jgi:hypothetical protein